MEIPNSGVLNDGSVDSDPVLQRSESPYDQGGKKKPSQFKFTAKPLSVSGKAKF